MKQLKLNKETLRRISATEAEQVAAGMRLTWDGCDTRSEECYPPTHPYRGCYTNNEIGDC